MQSPERPSHSIGFRLVLALLITLAAAKPILFDSIDPDCFWHLRVAGELRSRGIGPIVDTLCFASIRTPWTPYSWLAELGMERIWNTAGWRGAVAAHAILSGGFVWLLAAICDELLTTRGERREFNLLLAVLAGCVWSLAYLSFRPATLAIDLLALAAWLVARDRRLSERSRVVWFVVPIGLLLANIHLTALLLPIGLAAWFLGDLVRSFRADLPDVSEQPDFSARRRIALVVLTAIASVSTPMLPGVIRAVGDYSSHDVMVASPILAEMRPFYAGIAGTVSATLVGATVLAAIAHRRRMTGGDWLLLSIALVLVFRLGRFAPIFAIVGVPAAALTWPRLSDRLLQRKPVAIAFGVLLAMCIVRIATSWPGRAVTLDVWLNRNTPATGGFPTDAAAWVGQNISPRTGRIINEFNWGGYLGWRLGGRFQMLMDGRTQVQSDAFWRATYLGDVASRQAIIESSDADVAVVPAVGSIFAEPLQTLHWRLAFEDSRSIVFVPPIATP